MLDPSFGAASTVEMIEAPTLYLCTTFSGLGESLAFLFSSLFPQSSAAFPLTEEKKNMTLGKKLQIKKNR